MGVVESVGSAGAAPRAVQPWSGSGLAVAFAFGADGGVAGAAARVREAGARPVAVLDALRFGPLAASDTARDLPRTVDALGTAAQGLGLPVVGGDVVFEPAYAPGPFPDAVCVGVVEDSGRDEPAGDPVPTGDVEGRAWSRPGWIDALNADRAEVLPRASGTDLGRQVLRLVASPNLCDRSWLTDQFDRYVGGATVMAQPEDAGVLRVDGSGRGIAVAVDHHPRSCLLNPYLGAQLALGEAHRNVATTGAAPVAVAACLNVGSPDDPAAVWHLREFQLALADGAAELGTPITSLDVAFHGEDASQGPTAVVAVLGALEDVARATPSGLAFPGDAVVLLGRTEEELSGSVWADVVHGHLGGMPPMPNLAGEVALARVLGEASRRGLLTSAHDLAGGGLAQALVESALRRGLGVALTLPDGDPTVHLFSETPARALVSLAGPQYGAFAALCADAGVPVERLGEVIEDPVLEVRDLFTLALDEVRAAWAAPLRGVAGAS